MNTVNRVLQETSIRSQHYDIRVTLQPGVLEATLTISTEQRVGQVENTEVQKPKYGSGSMETEVQKQEEPISV